MKPTIQHLLVLVILTVFIAGCETTNNLPTNSALTINTTETAPLISATTPQSNVSHPAARYNLNKSSENSIPKTANIPTDIANVAVEKAEKKEGSCITNSCLVTYIPTLKKDINTAFGKKYEFRDYVDEDAKIKYTASSMDYVVIAEMLDIDQYIHNYSDLREFNSTYDVTKTKNLTTYANESYFSYKMLRNYTDKYYVDTPYGTFLENRYFVETEIPETHDKYYVWGHRYRVWCGNNVILMVKDTIGFDGVVILGIGDSFIPNVRKKYDSNSRQMFPIIYDIMKKCPVGQQTIKENSLFDEFNQKYALVYKKDLFYAQYINETQKQTNYYSQFDDENRLKITVFNDEMDYIDDAGKFEMFVNKQNEEDLELLNTGFFAWMNDSVINKYFQINEQIGANRLFYYNHSVLKETTDTNAKIMSGGIISFYHYRINKLTANYKKEPSNNLVSEEFSKINYVNTISILCRPNMIITVYAPELEISSKQSDEAVKNNIIFVKERDSSNLEDKADAIKQMCAFEPTFSVNLPAQTVSSEEIMTVSSQKQGCQYYNPSCGPEYDCVNNQCVLKQGCTYSNPSCNLEYTCENNICVLNTKLLANNSDVWSKNYGYSVEDCYTVCDDTYDIKMRTDICYPNCDMYKSSSTQLDRYVTRVKDIKSLQK